MEGAPQTLEEIGRAVGITRERVRQILMVAEKRLRSFVECELKDLGPARAVAVPDSQTVTKEELPPGGPNAEPSQEARTSIGALCSPGVPVLTQEEPQLVRLDLERKQETAEHIADAVGGQVALYEQPVGDLEGFSE
jgi:hypothetical protein